MTKIGLKMRYMAIIQYSSLVNKIIGKVGGSVFQKMGQSLGVREHRSFRPSGSVKAYKSRINFVSLASIWGALSLVQKQAWNTTAATYAFYNRYGTQIVLNGWQLFLNIQQVKLLTGGALDTVAKNYQALTPQITTDSPFSNYSGYWNPLLNPGNVAGNFCIYYITPIQTAIQVLTHQKWYFLYAVSAAGSDSTNLYNLCIALWGRKPVPSERFWYKVRKFDTTYNQWVDSNISQVTVAN